MYRNFRPEAGTSGKNTGTSGGPEISGENFRWAGNLRGELPPTTSGTPPERDPRNDLVEIALGPELPPVGRNFRPPEIPPRGPELPVLKVPETHFFKILFFVFDLYFDLFTIWV